MADREASRDADRSTLAPPQITLPKGGGAVRGMGEKFAANPVTGTGSMTVPIATSPGRSGFGPQLALSYDSAAGNGPFGYGWFLPLPSISRRTDRGLPRYLDADDSDVFVLSGAEDLVPELAAESDAHGEVGSGDYLVRRYRPRIEGSFARIERWSNTADPADVFWRSIGPDNVTTLYGRSDESRIVDPGDPTRIFSWLVCEAFDDKGNAIRYEHQGENADGVDTRAASERNRTRTAQRYLKRIKYGNRTPRQPDEDLAGRGDWLFELVLDYGEHQDDDPRPGDAGEWPCRQDPFSSYRSGFEVRTYRLCRRALMFHHFPLEEIGEDCLVKSTDFTYRVGKTAAAFLTSIAQVGYRRRDPGGYDRRAFPPMELEYSEARISDELRDIDANGPSNLPAGLDGRAYQWVDLDGEGISGVLSDEGGAWFYRRNLGPLRGGAAAFGPMERVVEKPSLGPISAGAWQIQDLDASGRPSLVRFDGPLAGFFERDADAGWGRFLPFESPASTDFGDPALRFADLTGDGLADILIPGEQAFTWYPSLGRIGFAAPERTPQAVDEERGPRLVFADGEQAVYLADLSGDGLSDLVRVRNGEICYWPNVGYGRFGAKVTMDDAPWFDAPDQFSRSRIRLVDVDGSGLTDIVYLGARKTSVYFNQSGNRWSAPVVLSGVPPVDDLTSVDVVDLLGNGTACLVVSSGLPREARRPARYVDLMGGQKPHLLVEVRNNLGGSTRIDYAPSTRFYLEDQAAGRPWIGRLPFPVHVVERVTIADRWRGTTFSSTYSYHHGHYDGRERELPCFGRVEQVDTEDYGRFAAGNRASPYITADQTLYQPPIKTVTWFCTGAALDRERVLGQFRREYFQGFAEKRLAEPDLDALHLSADEWHEAHRACRGAMLRQEVYELDVDALHPAGGRAPEQVPVRLLSATERSYGLRVVQRKGRNPHAVFLVTDSESLTYHYELDLRPLGPAPEPDPRISHTLNLSIDRLGNVQQSVSVGYPRARPIDAPELGTHADVVREVQGELHAVYTEAHYTNDVIDPSCHRLRTVFEVETYDLTGVFPISGRYFEIAELRELALSDTLPDQGPLPVRPLPYHVLPQDGAATKRLLGHSRTLFLADDLGGPLALGQLGKLGLVHTQLQLAFTGELLDAVFTDGQLQDETPAGATVLDEVRDPTASGYLVTAAGATDAYWTPSGAAGYDADAAQHFYLPTRYVDAFGHVTTVAHDERYHLYIASTTDPLGNTSSVERFDHRVLSPLETRDPSANHVAVAFDVLGLPVASAVMGQDGAESGDSLAGVVLDLAEGEVRAFLTSPFDAGAPTGWLGSATARFVHDFGAEEHPNGPTTYGHRPSSACAVVREAHAAAGGPVEIQIGIEYADGLGAVLVKKTQAEPDPASTEPDPPLRWIASGKTVFNNKGMPVKQYEPYFSSTEHRFEPAEACLEVGVTSLTFYDAAGRVLRIEMPDGTVSRAEVSPWLARSFDQNDTVLDPGNRWYAERTAAGASAEDARAARLAARHAGTPSEVHLDSLGREVVAVEHDRIDDGAGGLRDQRHLTCTRLDADGRPLWVREPRGNLVMQYLWPPRPDRDEPRAVRDLRPGENPNGDAGERVPPYDLAGTMLFQHGMDSGDRWMLPDAAGRPMFAWGRNERQDDDGTIASERRFHATVHDELRRPVEQWLRIDDAPAMLVERLEYRDTAAADGTPNPRLAADQAANLIGQLVRHLDPSGSIEVVRRDFRGNVLAVERRLNDQPEASLIDWQGDVATRLETEVFRQLSEYDALDRVVLVHAWHRDPANASAERSRYNRRGALDRQTFGVRAGVGSTAPLPAVIGEVEYDARGRRVSLRLGNGTMTRVTYDPDSFRLREARTTRSSDGAVLQHLLYTYDAVGNVTEVEDRAQETIFFDNGVVEPRSRYEYDALYRLTGATGRETAQGGNGARRGREPPLANGFPVTDQTLRSYAEAFEYDAAGNLTLHRHAVQGDTASSWVRHHEYEVDSNRLRRTWWGSGAGQDEITHGHDSHGNLRNRARVAPESYLRWDHRDMVRSVPLGGGGAAHYQYDASLARTRKLVRRNGSGTEERIYLGTCEVYRRRVAGAVVEEIESHHLLDGGERILLVEDALAGDRAGQTVHRYQYGNHLGSARLELAGDAAVVSYEEYHPYGTSAYRARDGALEAPPRRYRFMGHERDEESGLSYHRFRYQDPWLGRWVSADPGGIGDGTNRYAFVRDNPINGTDPSGSATKQPTQVTHLDFDPVTITGDVSVEGLQKSKASAPEDMKAGYQKMEDTARRDRIDAKLDEARTIREEGAKLSNTLLVAIFAISASPLLINLLWQATLAPAAEAAITFARFVSLGWRPALMAAGPALMKFTENVVNLLDETNILSNEMALLERGVGKVSDFVIKRAGERKVSTTVADLYGREAAVMEKSAPVDLGSAPSGATFHQQNGRYYSAPPGQPLKVPHRDVVGDMMETRVQNIANSFQPLRDLSPKQLKTLRKAEPAKRGGLMVAYKGSWVHARMEKAFPKLKWSRVGIDARGETMAYEVLTWTEYGVTSHLGRAGGMDDETWRAIYYSESATSISKYIDAVLR